jgi:predicted aspartyl protease
MKLKKILKQRGYVTVKLKTLPSGHHVLKAKVNGKKGLFILDTGASNTVVDTTRAKKFRLKLKESEHKATGAGSNEIDIHTTGKNKLEIGEWSKKKIKFVTMDLSHINTALDLFQIEVDGIIGADVLHEGKGIIQYDKNLLFLK